MQITVKKWGNSASVRIPATVMSDARLEIDSVVDVRVEEGRIVLEPVRPDALALDTLLAAITPENLHGETDFGEPVGKEAL
jgi:antitoxin MazE